MTMKPDVEAQDTPAGARVQVSIEDFWCQMEPEQAKEFRDELNDVIIEAKKRGWIGDADVLNDRMATPGEIADRAQCYGPEGDRHSPTTLETVDTGSSVQSYSFTCPECEYTIEL